jgi:hypothetical protein
MELLTRDPKIWGPSFWGMIDNIAAAFPDNASDSLVQTTTIFFNTLKVMLPCSECRTHYTNFCDATPIDLSSRLALIDWVAKLKISMTPSQKPKPVPAPLPQRRAPPVLAPITQNVKTMALVKRPTYHGAINLNRVRQVPTIPKKSCNCGGKK